MNTGLILNCERCGAAISEPAALVFSPPEGNSCIKSHICRACYELLNNWMADIAPPAVKIEANPQLLDRFVGSRSSGDPAIVLSDSDAPKTKIVKHELKHHHDIYICKICGGFFGEDVSDQECPNPIWRKLDGTIVGRMR